MAPTILFLASKIDEEALKLRYIVNACLSKWDKQENLWLPDKHNKDVSLDSKGLELMSRITHLRVENIKHGKEIFLRLKS